MVFNDDDDDWDDEVEFEVFNVIELSVVNCRFINFVIFWKFCFQLLLESSTYPSTAVFDVRLPKRFNSIIFAPESTSKVDDLRRKQCPVYYSRSGNLKYVAILLDSAPISLIPMGC